MWGDQEKQQAGICCCICCVAFLIILIATCWDSVDPTEYGLLCSKISKTCDQKFVYSSGRHMIGPFSYFLTFPGSLQTIEFSDRSQSSNQVLKTRTAEGLSLSLSISFQYQLIQDQIPLLYTMNNQQYEQTFIRIARDTILQAAGGYDAPSYWQERKKIGKNMQQLLDEELKKAHARCAYLQILRIDLPDAYEDSIVITQVEIQYRKMKEFEQQAQMILQQIDVLRSETEMKIKSINASANAEAYSLKQQAIAQSNQLNIDAEAQAYFEAKNATGFNDEELNQYIYYLSLMDKQNAKFLVGMDNVIADMRHT